MDRFPTTKELLISWIMAKVNELENHPALEIKLGSMKEHQLEEIYFNISPIIEELLEP